MSKRPKSKELVSDSNSDEDSLDKKAPADKKQQKKKKTEEQTQNATSWELGKKRRVSVSEFRGKKLIDIREYYTNEDGDEKPGRKGIALSIEQWNKLKEVINQVDNAIG
eukprot:gene9850-10861_t